MLQLRPNCEFCDKDLPPETGDARICSYECTFCAHCVDTVLQQVCPNCGGGFTPRPQRPVKAHRPGVCLAQQPASTQRVHSPHSAKDIATFSEKVRGGNNASQ